MAYPAEEEAGLRVCSRYSRSSLSRETIPTCAAQPSPEARSCDPDKEAGILKQNQHPSSYSGDWKVVMISQSPSKYLPLDHLRNRMGL